MLRDKNLSVRDVQEILDAHPLARVLTSMPGIGVRTAARILLEIGDASAFKTSAHLAAYAGIAPVTRRSGTSIRGEHPARTGNRKLKRAFFLAAFAALSDPVSRTYYDKKRAEGKKHNAALICLARRRCDVLFAMLRDKTHYQEPTTIVTRPTEARMLACRVHVTIRRRVPARGTARSSAGRSCVRSYWSGRGVVPRHTTGAHLRAAARTPPVLSQCANRMDPKSV